RKGKKSSSKKKFRLTALHWVLISGGAGFLVILVLCAGAISWFNKTGKELRERAHAQVEDFNAQRRARGEPGAPEDFPDMTYDSALLAEFTQSIRLGTRTVQIPGDFAVQPNPPGVQVPPNVSLSYLERPDTGPLGKLVFIAVSEPTKPGTSPSSFSLT